MTRSATRSQEDRAQFGPTASNPRFNTRMSALRNKLRSLPILEDHHMASFLIDDMIHYHFVFKEKRPEDLWYLLRQLWSYTGQMTGLDTRFIPRDPAIPEPLPVMSLPSTQLLAEPPSFDPSDADLKDRIEFIIENHKHYENDEFVGHYCTCRKEFESESAWIRHLRIRIYKAIAAHGGDAGGNTES